MTLGLLKETKLPETICEFKSAGFRWKIIINKKSTLLSITYNSISIIPEAESSHSNSTVFAYAYTTERGAISVELQYVQRIYNGLPDFLINMKKVFPELENLFAPLLEAAATE